MSTALDEVLSIRGKPLADGDVTISGRDPVHPTRFKVAETLAAVHAGIGVAVSDIWELKTGRRQKTRIDVRHAAAAVKSAYYLQRRDANGVLQDVANPEHEHMRRMTQPWPTRDGRWFLPHFGLPNLRARVLQVLECEATPEAVGRAVARRNALDLEAAIDEARACGGMVRSHEEWIATPHGSALAKKPIVEIIKIGDSAPEPLAQDGTPAEGVTVKLSFHPLVPERWDHLVDLFGPERGACAGCWCMWPRMRGVDFKALSRSERRDAFRVIVECGPAPGLLCYDGALAVGWVAISPRRAVHRFNIAKNSAPLAGGDTDLDSTWAITCFYIRSSHRGRSLTARLAEAAIAHARRAKGRYVEVCAVEPSKRLIWGEAFVGVASALRPLGFVEVARRSAKRPLLRLEL